mgnify:CR=1 FL=1
MTQSKVLSLWNYSSFHKDFLAQWHCTVFVNLPEEYCMSPYYLPRLLMVGMRWNAYPSIDHRQMPLKVLVESLVLRKTDKIRFICTNANAIHALLLCSYVSCLLSDKIKVYMHKCKCNPYTAIMFINIRCLLWHKIRFTQG